MRPGLGIVAAALGLAGSAGPVLAQRVDCAQLATQIEMSDCARGNWQIADDELNRLWRILKPGADDRGQGEALLRGQRLWLAERDARCEAERNRYAGGSIAPQVYWSCMEDVTLLRNREFRVMLGQ